MFTYLLFDHKKFSSSRDTRPRNILSEFDTLSPRLDAIGQSETIKNWDSTPNALCVSLAMMQHVKFGVSQVLNTNTVRYWTNNCLWGFEPTDFDSEDTLFYRALHPVTDANINISSLVTRSLACHKIKNKQNSHQALNFHHDLDLENSNPNRLPDTPAHDDTRIYQIWKQKSAVQEISSGIK